VLRKEGAGEFFGNEQYVQMLMKIGQEIKKVLNTGDVVSSCGIPIIEEVTIMRFYEAKSMADDNQIHALFN